MFSNFTFDLSTILYSKNVEIIRLLGYFNPISEGWYKTSRNFPSIPSMDCGWLSIPAFPFTSLILPNTCRKARPPGFPVDAWTKDNPHLAFSIWCQITGQYSNRSIYLHLDDFRRTCTGVVASRQKPLLDLRQSTSCYKIYLIVRRFMYPCEIFSNFILFGARLVTIGQIKLGWN